MCHTSMLLPNYQLSKLRATQKSQNYLLLTLCLTPFVPVPIELFNLSKMCISSPKCSYKKLFSKFGFLLNLYSKPRETYFYPGDLSVDELYSLHFDV